MINIWKWVQDKATRSEGFLSKSEGDKNKGSYLFEWFKIKINNY